MYSEYLDFITRILGLTATEQMPNFGALIPTGSHTHTHTHTHNSYCEEFFFNCKGKYKKREQFFLKNDASIAICTTAGSVTLIMGCRVNKAQSTLCGRQLKEFDQYNRQLIPPPLCTVEEVGA